MHALVTGAGGFVGRALVDRLLGDGALGGRPLQRLTLLDLRLDVRDDPRVQRLEGSIADAALLGRAFAEQPVDAVFHLASVPGGSAERQYEAARDVNLLGTQQLLEHARHQALQDGRPPVFVFASSIAALGAPLPAAGVDDDTPPRPCTAYGMHKLVGELWVQDFSRRGWVDGRSLRLPGVLARPPAPTGQASAFLSDLLRAVAAGRPFTCPTSRDARTWASSLGNTVDNLLHGASVPASRLPAGRALTLPTLHVGLAALAAAVAAQHGSDAEALVTWTPDAQLEALFGRFPPLATPAAEIAGFRHDGDLATLAWRALQA